MSSHPIRDTEEFKRLHAPHKEMVAPWEKWGAYMPERQWGTVREDYSENQDAWSSTTHDMARSMAFRWSEDGIGGWCDRYQVLNFSLALWNGKDPILKERLFGLSAWEGNHGEDVKEIYYYLDATPTHSYMKYLYKYPQAEFPYGKLVSENQNRSPELSEYELIDTNVFDTSRYFDVFIEYAKASPEDTCIRIEVWNRGPEEAEIHLIPQLYFRNFWSWFFPPRPQPQISMGGVHHEHMTLNADDTSAGYLHHLGFNYLLGPRYLYASLGGEPLFTNTETHAEKVWGPEAKSLSPFVKDAFHRYIVNGEECINTGQIGTKAAIHYANIRIAPGGCHTLLLRLTDTSMEKPLHGVVEIVEKRRREADAFYDAVHANNLSDEERMVQRQALSGMLWNKQSYNYDVAHWLDGDNPDAPPPASRKKGRNHRWRHLNSRRIMAVPDKWEYPWFAAWDLAFHAVTLALVDLPFAKNQLWHLLFEQFLHPSGQIPAYEWEFSDLNPPVTAWAVWRVYNMEREITGKSDRAFLERCFHKLMLNFSWWANKVDSEGRNVFEGGFLGLDNITVIDRSEPLPPGTTLEQSDGTGWMALYCLNLMRIALELAKENHTYEALAVKYFEHYVYIASAMKKAGNHTYEMWSETDGFFYDVLCYPDGTYHKFRVRSLVGIIPFFAIEVLDDQEIANFPEFSQSMHWFLKERQEMVKQSITSIDREGKRQYLLSIMSPDQLKRVLTRVWDPEEFRSPFGLRSLSKFHDKNPFIFGKHKVMYHPGEALLRIKGGNSNWRGPIWFPTTFLAIESLKKLHQVFGDRFQVIGPEGPVNAEEMARGFVDRLIRLFTRDANGRRPIYNNDSLFQEDPHFRDYLLFYEYYHADTGQGLGASHQTGWTGLIANLLRDWR